MRPDIVVLQEAYRGEIEHFRAGMASRTARSWEARYAPAVRLQDRNEGEGVLLLSAATVLASDSVQMAYPDAWTESRPALRARVDVGGAVVDVITTHLAAGEQGRDSRREQVRQLLAWAGSSETPVLIGGDLNAEPSTDEIAAVRTRWTDAWTALGRNGGETFVSDHPTRRIDYWFSRSITPVDATVVPACRAGQCLSDHNPLLTVFSVTRD